MLESALTPCIVTVEQIVTAGQRSLARMWLLRKALLIRRGRGDRGKVKSVSMVQAFRLDPWKKLVGACESRGLKRAASAEAPAQFAAIRVRNGNVDSRSHGPPEEALLLVGSPASRPAEYIVSRSHGTVGSTFIVSTHQADLVTHEGLATRGDC